MKTSINGAHNENLPHRARSLSSADLGAHPHQLMSFLSPAPPLSSSPAPLPLSGARLRWTTTIISTNGEMLHAALEDVGLGKDGRGKDDGESVGVTVLD